MNSVDLKSASPHPGIALGFRTFVLAPIGGVQPQIGIPYQ